MGIRPSMTLVFGSHDYDGVLPLYDDLDGVKIDDFIMWGNTDVDMHDAFFIPYFSSELSSVIGLKVGGVGDSRILRAIMHCLLTMCHFDGWIELPLTNSIDLYRSRMSERIPDCQMYANGFNEMVPHWRRVVMDGFDKMNIIANVDELKLMLVWEWS